ncbi:simple sugar transport system ATP-binding protein [Hydrogenispora ethanolica]|uniref:Simple sugar transport system ATP-binding protein n=1 Tax=Hydrogenispora ethanolica TaxID=1082276 RepID=A0A4V2QDZ7_HYDET|nr:ABC transporter ATP-binding protein [Hydrogenispora ethanolica]TCL65897.1 simple sugar transport system ATP-binding protein [Hydrogenispora ethanolica]
MVEEILRMDHITKVYPNGIMANQAVDFAVRAGEIHGLVGENGAGKSTLMKVLFGLETPEEGAIFLRGERLKLNSIAAAIQYGIGMVHQHFMLVPSLTVAENMVLGIEPRKNGLLDFEKAIEMTEAVAKKYNLPVEPRAIVADLTVGMKQKIEILKALLRGAKLLILDEPTAVLTPQETKELFKELIALKENGHTIIFISHKLKEIKEICDRITIMRGGRNVGVHEVKDVTEEDISRLMVGRDVMLKVEKSPCQPGKPVLQVNQLSYTDEQGKAALKNISFAVRSGEILGIAGVEGNGQRELVELITGLRSYQQGRISIAGQEIGKRNIAQIRAIGTAHIPEDRMTYGVAGEGSIAENLVANRIKDRDLNRGWLLDMKRIEELCRQLIRDYRVACSSPQQSVKMLSGGNMQKVVVAREVSAAPELLVADQPARGIDVGATEFIYKKLVELRENGAAILLVSADLNEVMELSDSLVVMYGGEIVAYFEASATVTEEELGLYMLGVKKQSGAELGRVVHE